MPINPFKGRDILKLNSYHYRILGILHDNPFYAPCSDECMHMYQLYASGYVKVHNIVPQVGTVYSITRKGRTVYARWTHYMYLRSRTMD